MTLRTESNDEGRDNCCVSPYLLRPLRSYQQVLEDRRCKQSLANSPSSPMPTSSVTHNDPNCSSRTEEWDIETQSSTRIGMSNTLNRPGFTGGSNS